MGRGKRAASKGLMGMPTGGGGNRESLEKPSAVVTVLNDNPEAFVVSEGRDLWKEAGDLNGSWKTS